MSKKYPYLGFGLGLRSKHYDYILENKPPVDWFEIVTENFLTPGGRLPSVLKAVAEHYPIVTHGVSLSIGSMDPLDLNYLSLLKNFIQDIKPKWVSDHLCWTGIGGKNSHDLLPLPYTEEALLHVVTRIKQVQDFLGQRIVIENPSSYVSFTESTFTEWDFMANMSELADCLILLDVNNVYVSSVNHGFNPKTYIDAIPVERVQQHHLAGHYNKGDFIIDTHGADIIDEVWSLYRYTVEKIGPVSTMIERDDDIPEFDVLFSELQHAQQIASDVKQQKLKTRQKHAELAI